MSKQTGSSLTKNTIQVNQTQTKQQTKPRLLLLDVKDAGEQVRAHVEKQLAQLLALKVFRFPIASDLSNLKILRVYMGLCSFMFGMFLRVLPEDGLGICLLLILLLCD